MNTSFRTAARKRHFLLALLCTAIFSISPYALASVPTTEPPVSQGAQQNILKNLRAQARIVVAQAIQAGVTVPQALIDFINTPDLAAVPVRNLEFGATGDDVRSLQAILIAQNKGPQAFLLKDQGITGIFGSLTRDTLAEYQMYESIAPATGYFGEKTRASMKAAGVAGIWW